MNPQNLLVLGGAKSGKTHYGAQLTLRLKKKFGAIKYYAQPENLEAFDQAIQHLSRGRLAPHTPVAVSKDIIMPLELANGRRAEVIWPDYGGEQVNQMLTSRLTTPAWRERSKAASGWLLMIRPELFGPTRDLLNRPLRDFEPESPQDAPVTEWIPEAEIIEVLQSLLFARRASRESKLVSPRLVVAITCWDESHDNTHSVLPLEELRRFVPMLANFIGGIWAPQAADVVGISSLGRALTADTDDEDFIEEGPHRHGYVVLPDGTHSPDLTWPLSKLLG